MTAKSRRSVKNLYIKMNGKKSKRKQGDEREGAFTSQFLRDSCWPEYDLRLHCNRDTRIAPLTAKTDSQSAYMRAIQTHALTFGVGPAGTGKSYCAAGLAADGLKKGTIDRILLTRPAVEAGENLGFLPGDIDEKFGVYIEAFREILDERLGRGAVDYYLRHGRIVAAPLAYMRGRTFGPGTFVILDEAQNTTIQQMKMFLTRIGTDCTVVINGDVQQSDLRGANGLADAIDRLSDLPQVKVHAFTRDDIVRSGLVRAVIDRYEVA